MSQQSLQRHCVYVCVQSKRQKISDEKQQRQEARECLHGSIS